MVFGKITVLCGPPAVVDLMQYLGAMYAPKYKEITGVSKKMTRFSFEQRPSNSLGASKSPPLAKTLGLHQQMAKRVSNNTINLITTNHGRGK